MAVTLGNPPLADFDQPIQMMKDCHRRIERFLGALLKVASEHQGSSLDEEHRRALEAALQYFRIAAPHHTQDEEESLFPRLRQVRDERVRHALSEIEGLEAEHAITHAFHREVEVLARRWLQHGQLDPRRSIRLLVILRLLQRLYAQHIDIEDRKVFSLAADVLGTRILEAMGHEMADRRGIDTDRAFGSGR